MLDPGVAVTAVDMLKGVLRDGTGRRYPLADGRPAAGKTGTQADNTNAWFVGFTPQLTTAVWIGDPERLHADGRRPGVQPRADVQGGLYPTQIWKTYMDAALAGQPMEDWAPPPADARPPARLYLPGNECLARAVTTGGEVTGTVPPAAAPPAAGPAGLRQPGPGAAGPDEPTARRDAARRRGTADRHRAGARLADHHAARHPARADRERHDRAPDVLDPRAPLPSTPLSSLITRC